MSPLMSAEVSSGTQPLPLLASSLPAQQHPISAYTNADVVVAEEQTALSEVIDLLITSPLKRVIVVDGERRVKGMISDVDILAHVQDEARPSLLAALKSWARGDPQHLSTGALRTATGRARIAADVMNASVVTILATLPVQDAVELMMATHHKILPVVDREERLLGVVGRFDLLLLFMEDGARL